MMCFENLVNKEKGFCLFFLKVRFPQVAMFDTHVQKWLMILRCGGILSWQQVHAGFMSSDETTRLVLSQRYTSRPNWYEHIGSMSWSQGWCLRNNHVYDCRKVSNLWREKGINVWRFSVIRVLLVSDALLEDNWPEKASSVQKDGWDFQKFNLREGC